MNIKRRKHDELRPWHMQKRAKQANGNEAWETRMMNMLEAAKPTPHVIADIVVMAVNGGVIVGVDMKDGNSWHTYKEGSLYVPSATNIREAMPIIIREIRKHAGVEYVTIRGSHDSLFGFKRYMLPYEDNTRVYAVKHPNFYNVHLGMIANKALNKKTVWKDVENEET